MYRITNDQCEFCILDLIDKVDEQIRKDKPKWFSMNGTIKGNCQTAYIDYRKNELVKHDNGPCFVWESLCTDCGNPLKICVKHLKQILSELEERGQHDQIEQRTQV